MKTTYEFIPVQHPIKHVIDERVADVTLCQLFVDPCDHVDAWCDGFHDSYQRDDWIACTICAQVYPTTLYNQARAEVARELNVDESEVF